MEMTGFCILASFGNYLNLNKLLNHMKKHSQNISSRTSIGDRVQGFEQDGIKEI